MDPIDRPGGTAPHVVVSDVADPILDTDDRHHLDRVRRLRSGDRVSVTDGRGAWRWCRFGDPLELDGPIVFDPRPTPELSVAFAITKGDRPEIVVQKLTEIGVDRIIPFTADRSVVRWDAEKAARNHERFSRIARGATMQSRRTWSPIVEPVATFAEVAARPGAVRADIGTEAITARTTLVMIGPEGGWSEDERSIPTVSLGGNVLRAETAAIVAAALMVDRRAGR